MGLTTLQVHLADICLQVKQGTLQKLYPPILFVLRRTVLSTMFRWLRPMPHAKEKDQQGTLQKHPS